VSQPREWFATVRAFKRAFPIVKPYLGYVPIYPAMQWSWVVGSQEIDPASIDEVTTQSRLDGMRTELRVYNTAMHRAAFALPTYVHALLQLTERDEPPTSADLRAAGHPLPGVIA